MLTHVKKSGIVALNGSLCFRVDRVVDLEFLAPNLAGIESHQGHWIKTIQLAKCGTSVVITECIILQKRSPY